MHVLATDTFLLALLAYILVLKDDINVDIYRIQYIYLARRLQCNHSDIAKGPHLAVYMNLFFKCILMPPLHQTYKRKCRVQCIQLVQECTITCALTQCSNPI